MASPLSPNPQDAIRGSMQGFQHGQQNRGGLMDAIKRGFSPNPKDHLALLGSLTPGNWFGGGNKDPETTAAHVGSFRNLADPNAQSAYNAPDNPGRGGGQIPGQPPMPYEPGQVQSQQMPMQSFAPATMPMGMPKLGAPGMQHGGMQGFGGMPQMPGVPGVPRAGTGGKPMPGMTGGGMPQMPMPMPMTGGGMAPLGQRGSVAAFGGGPGFVTDGNPNPGRRPFGMG